ncbi:MAG: hypothetical protein V1765_00240 [bacterium]
MLKKVLKIQLFVLLLGTIFAWANFAIEVNQWLSEGKCELGCPIFFEASPNPFVTPCFLGALFFTLSFVLSILAWRAFNKKK